MQEYEMAPMYILTPGAGDDEETPVIRTLGYKYKSFYVIPRGGDAITVDLLARFGNEEFLPFQSLSGGVAQPDKIFAFTLAGDILDEVKIRVTVDGGDTPPDQILVRAYGSRE